MRDTGDKLKVSKFIILTGFMGSGKTSIGRRLAKRLQLPFYDTDRLIEQKARHRIATIFKTQGESVFRRLEKEILKQVLSKKRGVIATGGGMILDKENRRLMKKHGFVIHLTASPKTLMTRLRKTARRPLLRGNVAQVITRLLRQRAPLYKKASLTITTDGKKMGFVLDEIVKGFKPPMTKQAPVFIQRSFAWPRPVQKRIRGASSVVLVTDTKLKALYGKIIFRGLRRLNRKTLIFCVPRGEAAKTLKTAEGLYKKMNRAHCDRSTLLLTLGGGSISDLGGFVAATYQRGLDVIHIPTTLLAQTDAALGGKTAVNLGSVKNQIGLFHQPLFIIVALDFLKTLSEREYRSGLSEIVKHAAIADASFFDFLSKKTPLLFKRDVKILEEALSRSIRIKLKIVTRDEREKDERRLLNFGHTFGHALEMTSPGMTHGEAVALGMLTAADFSRQRGLCTEAAQVRLASLIRDLHLLPKRLKINPKQILKCIVLDKKREKKTIHFVFLKTVGHAVVRTLPLTRLKTYVLS